MQQITIRQAQASDSALVAEQVTKLLLELAPETADEFAANPLERVTITLLQREKIVAFLAYKANAVVGVLTLHECASIYAGGIFGEISELYVAPDYRSLKIGDALISAAKEYASNNHWQRLEVSTPSADSSSRTAKFYEGQGFKVTGLRMRCLIN